jgi:hypothetical protein
MKSVGLGNKREAAQHSATLITKLTMAPLGHRCRKLRVTPYVRVTSTAGSSVRRV